jgi:16S rRNA processing protein RimM
VAAEPFEALTLARILRPWGRRGEVAAEILTDFPARLASLRKVWLSDGRVPPRPVSVISCRIHVGQAIILFEGEDPTTHVERLRGLELQVPFSERVALGPNRHYISDLVGCAVWEDGTELGAVRDVRNSAEPRVKNAPESWLLAVDTPTGELLIPLAAEICTGIDTAARRIDVRLPSGLREINLPQSSPQSSGKDAAE